MKKILAVAAIAGAVSMVSTEAHARGYIEVGTEVERHNSDYESSDITLPYVAGRINPLEDSPWYVETKLSYQRHEDTDRRSSNRRKRYELYTGYSWKFGDFAFTPKAGVRLNDYADGNTHDYQAEYRFYPNASYKINDTTSWFFSGFVAHVDSNLNDGKKRSGDSAATGGEHYSDYKHELNSGFRFMMPNGDRLTTSIYSEYSRQVHNSSTEEYQLRLQYQHKLSNGKTTIEPFARIGLDKEVRSKTGGVDRDTLRHRFGTTVAHKVTDTFSVRGEVYYQTERQESSSTGERNNDRNRMFYKLGFRQEF